MNNHKNYVGKKKMDNTDDVKFERKLRLFPLTNIVIANMIGAGIFTTSGLLMNDLKNPMLMVSLWVVGGLIALCGALCYGELGAAMPHAGGEYAFLSRLYHPMFGFLSGWISLIAGFSAPVAAASIGFSEYFARAFPFLFELGFGEGIFTPLIAKKLFSILAITLFTVIHFRGISFGAIIQSHMTTLKVGLILVLILLGFLSGNGDFSHIAQGESLLLDFGGWKTIGMSLMWITFAYSGWNASTYVGSEVKDPEKNIPRSLLLGTGIVILLYVCLNILYVYAIHPDNMKGVTAIGGLASSNLFGEGIGTVFSLIISFALISSLSAFTILGPRVYFAMAKDGRFFKFASDIHPRFNSPSKAIILQWTISVLIVLTGSFEQILTYMGFTLGIFPILAVLGVFKLRKLKQSNYKFPGFRFVPLIYIFFGVSILLLSLFERPIESIISILTVLLGIPAFFLFKGKPSKSVSALSHQQQKDI